LQFWANDQNSLPSEYSLNQFGEQGWKISASGGMGDTNGYGWIILMREKIE